jgi:hypothetical protein
MRSTLKLADILPVQQALDNRKHDPQRWYLMETSLIKFWFIKEWQSFLPNSYLVQKYTQTYIVIAFQCSFQRLPNDNPANSLYFTTIEPPFWCRTIKRSIPKAQVHPTCSHSHLFLEPCLSSFNAIRVYKNFNPINFGKKIHLSCLWWQPNKARIIMQCKDSWQI